MRYWRSASYEFCYDFLYEILFSHSYIIQIGIFFVLVLSGDDY